MYELEEIPHQPVAVVSYGLLLKHDAVGVSIASEQCDKSCYRGYSFIPAGMLVRVKPVHTKGRKRKAPAPVADEKPPV